MARISQNNFATIIASLLAIVCPSSQIVLDPEGSYEVTWETFDASQSVVFSLVVGTSGWIGFGISNEGTMDGADIAALEWVTLSEYEFTVNEKSLITRLRLTSLLIRYKSNEISASI
jgi:hypothetical protein